jgi:conflict system STAND superfamily ATPase
VVPYALQELGWLQFQQLCDLVLELEAGADPTGWRGEADRLRRLHLEDGLSLPRLGLAVPGPVRAHAAWAAAGSAIWRAAQRGVAQSADEGPWPDTEERAYAGARVVLTSVDRTPAVERTAVARVGGAEGSGNATVLGRHELARIIEARADLRLRMPSLLGVRPLDGLVDAETAARSSVDASSAHALARVFVPTRAHARALDVLARHRFAVLTGPPEMGKTAAATMIALARMTAGWEAHDCRSPDDLLAARRADSAQVFVADDAFGSTEYRPDAAERWARELPRILRVLDDRHWLIWTSRPAPLRAGLHRVHQERGTERFPRPGEVRVDAGALTVAEKALIFLRHVRAADVPANVRLLARRIGPEVVAHPHFTPERIRRFAATRLADLPRAGRNPVDLLRVARDELAEPTDAMAASFRALEPEYRALLVAMLDQPDGAVAERELVAVLHRHQTSELARRPADLIDRLADHFLRVLP